MAEETDQILGGTLSSMCVLMGRPWVMTGVFRSHLIQHFQQGHMEHPEIERLIWSKDEKTGILIETNTNWTPEKADRRPAIIIKRNDLENLRLGIGDSHQGLAMDGRGRFTTFWTGSHTLFAIGDTGAQAEVLATEVQRQLTQYSQALMEDLGLLRFRVLGLGAVSELEEWSENFVVPVTVGYAYEESWAAGPEAPRLSKITIKLRDLL